MRIRGLDYTLPLDTRVKRYTNISCTIKHRRLLLLNLYFTLMLIIRLIIMLEVSKPKQGLELVACRDQKFWKCVY